MISTVERDELRKLGFRKSKEDQYQSLSRFNQFVIIRKNVEAYSIEIDGVPIKSNQLSFSSLLQILTILYR